MLDISSCPMPVTYRELWLPRAINGTGWPSSRYNGNALTLTGASKATTADGVHFTGTATSNIVVTAAAGQNLQQAFHITIRFKLDQTFAAGAAANQYLFQKRLDANNWIRIYLAAVNGVLYWEQGNGAGGIQFGLSSTTVSWTAGIWYTVTVSMTNTPTQRMLVNGTLEDNDVAAAVATPNGGDMVIGSSSDGGADGVVGTISWVVIGVGTTAATALTAAEEGDINRGIPPATAKVQYMYLLDEGRGVTATDRGSAAGNGTLDSANTWVFGQVEQPVFSLDGINDYATSGVGLDIQRPLTYVWVGRLKSTYLGLAASHTLFQAWIADDNNTILLEYNLTGDQLRLQAVGGGVSATASYTSTHSINDYIVFIGSLTAAGALGLYVNGSLSQSASGVGAISGAAATARIGVYRTAALYFDISKTLLVALIEGAFTAKQALAYSRWLRDIFNLPISM